MKYCCLKVHILVMDLYKEIIEVSAKPTGQTKITSTLPDKLGGGHLCWTSLAFVVDTKNQVCI